MVFTGDQLTVLLVAEVLQVAFFWAVLRQRYWRSLHQLGDLTRQLAEGQRPRSYFIDGPRQVERIAQNLEKAGLRLEELQRQRQEEDFNLHVLLANMVEGVMVVDERHVVRLINDVLLDLFSLKQSPLGRTVLESLRESRVEMIVRETLRQGLSQQREVALESTALAMRHFAISSVPFRTKTNEIRGAVLVFHDITRLKQLEVVRQEFVANVSHELRTPLAIFRGYLETFAEHPRLARDEVQRMLGAMRRHANRLNAMVEDLLTLTRLESGQIEARYEAVRIDAFFSQIIRDWEVRRDSEGETVIATDVPVGLPPLEVDVLRFEQIILNLVENAVAYSLSPRRILLTARTEGNHMELRVADNGIGIPPADLPHIFERFYRVNKSRGRSSGGTGLGLSIVKHIVQAHGGTVVAESEMGKGTTLILRLPLKRGPHMASDSQSSDSIVQ